MARRAILVVAFLLAGCQAAGPQGLVSGPTTIGVASLVSDNGAGLISNNAGSLTGVIRGPSAGLIANNGGGLLSNNAAGLLSNNAAGLISNNSGGLVSNGSGSYRVLLAGETVATVPNAVVVVRDDHGEPLSTSVRTDAEGHYELSGLKPSGPVVFVSATYSGGGMDATLTTAVPAPRAAGAAPADIDPASTLFAKKLSEAARSGAVGLTALDASTIATARQAIADTMSDDAALAAALLNDNRVAQIFDAMLGASPSLKTIITTTLADADLAGVLVATPTRVFPAPPSAKPVAPAAPLAAAPAFPIFDEAFASGWSTDGTWNGEALAGSDVTPDSGATAIAWTTGGRGGLKCTTATQVDTSPFASLVFSLRAPAGAQLKVQALDGTTSLGHAADLTKFGELTPDTWKRFSVPLAAIAAANRQISGFMLLEQTGKDQRTIYLDRVGFEK